MDAQNRWREDEEQLEELLGDATRAEERALLKQLLDGDALVTVTTPDGRALYASRPLREEFGYSLEELDELSVAELYANPVDREELLQSLQEEGHAQLETTLMGGDGKLRTVSVSAWDTQIGGKTHIIAQFSDVTEYQRRNQQLKEQLEETRVLAALGRIAGGVSHEYNNLLTGITGSAELALLEGMSDEAREEVGKVLRLARRAADLTQKVQSFGGRRNVQRRAVDVNQLVRDQYERIRTTLGRDVSVETDLTAERDAHADPALLSEGLHELVVYARDAMRGDGRYAVRTRDEDVAERPGLRPGAYVVLETSDDGPVPVLEDLRHLFDPFYACRKLERGDVLGLPKTYGIATQMNGTLDALRGEERGTTFRMYLPAAEEGF